MSTTQLTLNFQVGGVLTDPTSVVLSDAGATYGVKRLDTSAVVVAAGTAMVRQSTGIYQYTFTDPAPSLTYQWIAKVVYSGQTDYYQFTKTGGIASPTGFYLKFSELKSAAERAAGEKSQFNNSGVVQIVNRALELFNNYAKWNWREKLTTLDFAANQAQIALPLDFGELISLKGNVSKYTTMEPADWGEIQRIRVWNLTDTFRMWYHVSSGGQSSPGSVPVRVLEVAPVPTSTVAKALYLAYRAILPPLTSDTDVPGVPVGMFGTVLQLVRAFACLDALGAADKKTAAEFAFADRLLDAAKTEDAGAGGAVMGPLIGAAADYRRRPTRFWTQALLPGDAGY